jgi:hypothetical protein
MVRGYLCVDTGDDQGCGQNDGQLTCDNAAPIAVTLGTFKCAFRSIVVCQLCCCPRADQDVEWTLKSRDVDHLLSILTVHDI